MLAVLGSYSPNMSEPLRATRPCRNLAHKLLCQHVHELPQLRSLRGWRLLKSLAYMELPCSLGMNQRVRARQIIIIIDGNQVKCLLGSCGRCSARHGATVSNRDNGDTALTEPSIFDRCASILPGQRSREVPDRHQELQSASFSQRPPWRTTFYEQRQLALS